MGVEMMNVFIKENVSEIAKTPVRVKSEVVHMK